MASFDTLLAKVSALVGMLDAIDGRSVSGPRATSNVQARAESAEHVTDLRRRIDMDKLLRGER
jgi:hypothetical protein